MDKSLLEGTYNTRDIGGYEAEGGRRTAKGVFWRSDRQCALTSGDIGLLLERGFTTVIDVRAAEEVQSMPNDLASAPGFDYHSFPIFEGSIVPKLPDEVVGSYMRIAHSPSMSKVFKTIAHAPGGVMYNCSAGKDRTGVISAILLMLCGVSSEDIAYDYLLTRENCGDILRKYAEEHPPLDINVMMPRESYIYGFMEQFMAEFGNAEDYLLAMGLDAEEISATKNKLLKDR